MGVIVLADYPAQEECFRLWNQGLSIFDVPFLKIGGVGTSSPTQIACLPLRSETAPTLTFNSTPQCSTHIFTRNLDTSVFTKHLVLDSSKGSTPGLRRKTLVDFSEQSLTKQKKKCEILLEIYKYTQRNREGLPPKYIKKSLLGSQNSSFPSLGRASWIALPRCCGTLGIRKRPIAGGDQLMLG
jgi:hypothetical protein